MVQIRISVAVVLAAAAIAPVVAAPFMGLTTKHHSREVAQDNYAEGVNDGSVFYIVWHD